MHYCDRKNQHLGYFGAEHKCRRKYNSLLFKMMELFGLDNARVVWFEQIGQDGEAVHKQHDKFGSRRCREKLFRKWAKECVLRNPRDGTSTHIYGNDIMETPLLGSKKYHEDLIIIVGRGFCCNCNRKVNTCCLRCSTQFGRVIRICDLCTVGKKNTS